jgi:hypothetical protein
VQCGLVDGIQVKKVKRISQSKSELNRQCMDLELNRQCMDLEYCLQCMDLEHCLHWMDLKHKGMTVRQSKSGNV